MSKSSNPTCQHGTSTTDHQRETRMHMTSTISSDDTSSRIHSQRRNVRFDISGDQICNCKAIPSFIKFHLFAQLGCWFGATVLVASLMGQNHPSSYHSHQCNFLPRNTEGCVFATITNLYQLTIIKHYQSCSTIN